MKSDSKGFLIADSKIEAHDLARGIDAVHSDTSAMLALMKRQGNANILQRARVSGPNSRTSPGPSSGTRERDSQGRFVKSKMGTEVAKAVNQMTRQQTEQAAANKRAEAAKRNREGGTAADGQARDGRGRFGAGDDDGSKDKKDGLFSRLKSALSDRAGTGDMDKVDPAIEASKELSGLLSGPMKALGSIGESVIGRGFSGEAKDRSIPWYRRILVQLKLLRKDESDFSKAETKAIKDIHTGGGGGGDKSVGLFAGLLPDGALSALKGLGGFAAKAALPLATIFSAVKSFGTSTDEYASRLGTKDDGGIAKSIGIRTVGVLGDLGNTLTFGMAGKLGETLSPAVADIVDKSKAGIDAIKEKAAPVVEAVKAAAAPVITAVSNAKDWVLGKTSKFFESGKGGAGTISSGKGDRGGASYGTYQLASKTGTLNEFLKGSKYGKEFDGLTPGTPEFNAKWKEIAANDPQFGAAQHDFIKQTHFDPQMKQLQGAGIDLSGRGAAVQDSIWSTAVQFGGKSSLIQSALKGRDTSKMSDTEIVSAIQDYKIANNDSLFKSSSSAVRTGTMARASSEKDKLVALANTGVASPIVAAAVSSPGVSESMKMPSISVSAPNLPAQAPRADIPMPLSSKAPLEVTVRNDQLANQDVRDRRIAAIASGGLSN